MAQHGTNWYKMTHVCLETNNLTKYLKYLRCYGSRWTEEPRQSCKTTGPLRASTRRGGGWIRRSESSSREVRKVFKREGMAIWRTPRLGALFSWRLLCSGRYFCCSLLTRCICVCDEWRGLNRSIELPPTAQVWTSLSKLTFIPAFIQLMVDT